jgi:hypothetical protein
MSVNEIEKKTQEAVQKFWDQHDYYLYGDERDRNLAVLTATPSTHVTDADCLDDVDKRKRDTAIDELTHVMQEQGHSPEAIDEVIKATIESFSKE